MGTDTSSLVLDHETKRLLELCAQQYRSDDDIQEIQAVVNAKAPKLLDGLTESNCTKIAKDLQVRCYEKDQVVFCQNDPPDCYYTVIRGAVSIYALSNTTSTGSNADNNKESSDRNHYGKFLVQLPPGNGFGELSFNSNGKHSRRNAGVVSDGSHGQSRVLIRSDESTASTHLNSTNISSAGNGSGGGSGVIEVEASNVAVLLCIPEKLYMAELFPRHAAKHQTKEKLAFLRSSFLFSQWPADQLIKLAYSMKKKTFVEGTTIAREGDRIEFVYMIREGKIRVLKQIKDKQRKRMQGGSAYSDYNNLHSADRSIDIAELAGRDIIGLVELAGKSKKMQREFLAIKTTDVFAVPLGLFVASLDQESSTMSIVKKIVAKRSQWEMLRVDYAKKFSTMPSDLPKNWKSISSYKLLPDSILSEKERRVQSAREMVAYRQLREARACYRLAMTKKKLSSSSARPGMVMEGKEELVKAKALCEDARSRAKDAFCCERKRGKFLADVEEQENCLCSAE